MFAFLVLELIHLIGLTDLATFKCISHSCVCICVSVCMCGLGVLCLQQKNSNPKWLLDTSTRSHCYPICLSASLYIGLPYQVA